MEEYSEIDETYNLYEKRYELTKLAIEAGLSKDDFNRLSSKDKFLTLSDTLRKTNRVHLASFFFGKLFDISNNFEALINKTECLIELGEFDEALRFNSIAFELYLEDPEIKPKEVEEKLFYTKALIYFSTEKYSGAEWLCEECIIKYKNKNFYYLLCTIFIAMRRFNDAKKFFNKYSDKFGSQLDFLIEVFVLLLNVSQLEKAIEFINGIHKVDDKQKLTIIDYINNYYTLNKNKTVLKQFFENEVKIV